MNFFPKVKTWFVLEDLLSASLAEISHDGARGRRVIMEEQVYLRCGAGVK
jgi:hypothetical protein